MLKVSDKKMEKTLKKTGSIYFSELVSIILNLWTIAIILQSYLLITTIYSVIKRINELMYYFLVQSWQSDVFVDYYNRALCFLERRRLAPVECITESEARCPIIPPTVEQVSRENSSSERLRDESAAARNQSEEKSLMQHSAFMRKPANAKIGQKPTSIGYVRIEPEKTIQELEKSVKIVEMQFSRPSENTKTQPTLNPTCVEHISPEETIVDSEKSKTAVEVQLSDPPVLAITESSSIGEVEAPLETTPPVLAITESSSIGEVEAPLETSPPVLAITESSSIGEVAPLETSPPATPTVVVAEIHMHDTPTSEAEENLDSSGFRNPTGNGEQEYGNTEYLESEVERDEKSIEDRTEETIESRGHDISVS